VTNQNQYLEDRGWEYVPNHGHTPFFSLIFRIEGKEAIMWLQIDTDQDPIKYSLSVECEGHIDPIEPNNFVHYMSGTDSISDVVWEANLYISIYGDVM